MTTIDESARSAMPEADRALIAEVPQRMVAAWAQHDADAFAELFIGDGTMTLPGVFRQGRDEIRSFMASAFAGPYKGTRVTGTPISLLSLSPDSAVLTTVGGVLAPGETTLSDASAIRASWVVVRRGDGWSLAAYHNCPRDSA